MKGLFYYRTHFDDPQNAGVVKKCRHIAAAFQQYGYQADTIFFSEHGLLFNERTWGRWPFKTTKGSLAHALFFFVFADSLLLRNLPFADYRFIWIRHLPTHPAFLLFLRRLKRRYPHLDIIIDFPTWPYDRELGRGLRGRFLLWLDQRCRRWLCSYVSLALHSGPEADIWGIKSLQLTDGIRPEDFPVRVPATADGHSLALIFAGRIAHWHGLDRALVGLKQYYAGGKAKSVRISLTIIGQGEASARLQHLTQQWGLEEYVRFVGTQNAQELWEYYALADLAVGSLARHRIGINQGTPLKHREYCAVGLPFVFAGDDADFRPDFPYALQIPADDTPLDMIALHRFYQHVSKERDFQRRMQAFAHRRLAWTVKVGPVVTYLQHAH